MGATEVRLAAQRLTAVSIHAPVMGATLDTIIEDKVRQFLSTPP